MNRKQRYPRVIVFFGSDGAGKSTQTQLLIGYLKSHGRRTQIAWLRGRHSLAFVIAKFFTKMGYHRIVKVPSGVTYRVFDPGLLPRLQRFWGVIEFLSVLPWIILRVYLPRALGYTVVAERYVVDTVAYLSYWLGQDFLRSFLAKVLLNFIPQGSVLIHLDAETQDLLERLKRIRYDTATKDYIVFQKRIYRILSKTIMATTINTSRYSTDETFQRILNVINAQYGN